jgi:hypothetical protein
MIPINDGLLYALITAAASIITILVSKGIERLIAKSADQATREQNLDAGIRVDLGRKDLEITNLKTELREVELELDTLRIKYLGLIEKIYKLRMMTSGLLLAAGKTQEEIDAILPEISIDELLGGQ